MNNDSFITTTTVTLIGLKTILGYKTQFAESYEYEFEDDAEYPESEDSYDNLLLRAEDAFAEYAPLFKLEGAKRIVEANIKKLSSKVFKTLKTDQWNHTFDDCNEWEYLLFKKE